MVDNAQFCAVQRIQKTFKAVNLFEDDSLDIFDGGRKRDLRGDD